MKKCRTYTANTLQVKGGTFTMLRRRKIVDLLNTTICNIQTMHVKNAGNKNRQHFNALKSSESEDITICFCFTEFIFFFVNQSKANCPGCKLSYIVYYRLVFNETFQSKQLSLVALKWLKKIRWPIKHLNLKLHQ